MKRFVFFLSLAACAAAVRAQTPTKAPTPSSTTAKATTAKATTGKATTGKATVSHGASGATASILPASVPRAPHGPMKAAFALRYEDMKIGTGAVAEPNKIYKVFYTGYLGANGRPDDGHKFDSSDDHRRPILKDGRPVMGEDGKPELGEPEPLEFPQGFGRLIPGFDQGFDGMKIGGKRRLFIPWQLAYGAHGRPGPDAANPGIPPKSDLIFDVELVDVRDLPMAPNHPGMGMHPMPGGVPPRPGNPTGNPGATPPAGTAPGSTAAPASPATPAQPATPPQAPATPPPGSSQQEPK
ncbi:MAG TPA: FKBP-type peptidyl-prolyl cis-trans isomerase [Terracidiphilus sp.]